MLQKTCLTLPGSFERGARGVLGESKQGETSQMPGGGGLREGLVGLGVRPEPHVCSGHSAVWMPVCWAVAHVGSSVDYAPG